VRRHYIDALKAADNHDIGPLLAFARSWFFRRSLPFFWKRPQRRPGAPPAAEGPHLRRLRSDEQRIDSVDRPRQTFYC
jgi:hypothetical protein